VSGTSPDETRGNAAEGITEGGKASPSPASATEPSRCEQLVADLTLFSVAVVWGFNFVVIKDAVGRIDPMLYVLLRYVVAFVMFAAITPRTLTRRPH